MTLTPSEWHRRFVQQARWTAEMRRHLYKKAGYLHARRILEVGCGTGALLAELGVQFSPLAAEEGLGKKSMHGLDIDRAFISTARIHAPAALLTQADAHELPFTRNSFDISCCHFLLLWVSNPQQVVNEMRRVTRPGGYVLAFAEPDYGGRIDYPAELELLGQLQERALQDQGAEPRLGRRLGAIFNQAGLQDVEYGLLGGQWRTADPDEGGELEREVLKHDLQGMIETSELEKLIQIEKAARQRGDRLLFVPTFYAWGKVR